MNESVYNKIVFSLIYIVDKIEAILFSGVHSKLFCICSLSTVSYCGSARLKAGCVMMVCVLL